MRDSATRGAILPVTISLAAVAVSIWGWRDFAKVEEALTAYRSGLYLQPWRAISSVFLHVLAPHLIFNVVTLLVIGARVAIRYGVSWLVACFFLGAFVGQVAHTLIGPSFVVGISGGVCALYGFLLVREWKGAWIPTLRSWAMFWIYPLLLLALLVADQIGLLNIANVNHIVGIAIGALLAKSATSSRKRYWQAATSIVVLVAGTLAVYRPWDLVWRAVHNVNDVTELLQSHSCDDAPGLPSEGVLSATPLVVTIRNPDRPSITVSYVDRSGDVVEIIRTRARARSFRPLKGSVWFVADENGECIGKFAADRDGVVTF